MNKILTFFCLLGIISIFSQSHIAINENSKQYSRKENRIIEKSPNIQNEEKLYQLLYENSKDYNEKILSTVEWTIGLSFAFLLAIFGSQVFFNWRVNKKDLDNIHKDISEKFSEMKSELLREITETDKINKNKIQEITANIERKLLDRVNEEFKEKQTHINLIDELSKVRTTSLEKSVNSDFKKIHFEIDKINGDIWNLKGVKSNALSNYLTSALSGLESGENIKSLLDEIISTLKELEEIHNGDYKKLEELITKLESKYDSQKELIKKNFINKPVYEFNIFQNQPFNFLPTKRYIKK